MCGIAGIVGCRDEGQASKVVARMGDCQSHRGPNQKGHFAEPGIALAHRRLAVIDPSEAARQPMRTPDGRYVLVYNGEVYNFPSLRARLEGTGVEFRSNTDAEVVLHALARWGRSALSRLSGMFALAFWDRERRRLLLARDRLGIRPLYFSELSGGRLLFASEVKSLLASGLVPPALARDRLPEFLSQQTVLTPHTLVRGIRMLQPGHVAVLDRPEDTLSHERYWSPADEMNEKDEFPEARGRAALREVVTEAVEARLVSDVPLGAFLSGGIDSTLVVGLMSRLRDESVSTFTLAFDDEGNEDVGYARLVADRFGTDHREVRVDEDELVRQVDRALDVQDHPSGDGVNTFLVSSAAREAGLTVALSGIGGDELFGGYPTFRRLELLQRTRWVWRLLPDLLRRAAGEALCAVRSTTATRKLRDLLLAEPDVAAQYAILRSVFSSDEISSMVTASPARAAPATSVWNRLADLPPSSVFTRASLAEMTTYMRDVLLRDADQMGMASSLEIRVPFLDRGVVQTALQLGDGARRPSGTPKRFLAQTFSDIVPESVAERPKQGFTLPMARWMRGPLRARCETALDRVAAHGAFHGHVVHATWEDFLDGRRDTQWSRPWLLVALGAWMGRTSVA